MLLNSLIELGLTDSEAKVYLALLELGSSQVSVIAKKSNVNRVACYHTLENLIEKGLVSGFEKNKIKFFTVENPETLVNKEKERLKKAQNILPELLSITNILAYKPKIRYYEGLNGIKSLFEDTLNSKGEILGYTNLTALPQILPKEFIQNYAAQKIANKIKSRMLSPGLKEARKYLENFYPKDFDHNFVEILFVNPDQFMFEYEINIYDNKVSIISLNSQELIGFVVESPVYAKTERAIFNLAWLGATAFVAR